MSELVTLARGADDVPREGMHQHYVVELLFAEAPRVDRSTLERALADLRGVELRLSPALDDVNSALVAQLGGDGIVQFSGTAGDAGIPPSWLVSQPAKLQRSELDDAVSQSWWWPDAESTLAGCDHRMRIVDRHMLGLDYQRRLRHMQQVVAACSLALEPQALHWPSSEQLLDPRSFAKSVRQDGFGSPLPGGFNVRFFELQFEEDVSENQSRDVDFLMDTRGLGALGLVDLQCHFRGLDPEDVSHVLYSTGNYLFDKGRVITAGNTVQGPGPRDAWLCRAGDALGPPPREVIDLDPGFPFAAQSYEDDADGVSGGEGDG